jgi:hypothetical protein
MEPRAVVVILFLDKQNVLDRYEAKMEPRACIIPVSRFFLAKPLAAVWVGGELRLTFRRAFSNVLMEKWELIVEQVSLNEDLNALVWCYEKSGTYSSHSCYSIISYRRVKPVYIPVIWSIVVPPKIHLFLWLVAYNKLATVDNLNKKGLMKNPQCCFCNENESVSHLFFECVVAKVLWKYVSEFLGFDIGQDYMSVASTV